MAEPPRLPPDVWSCILQPLHGPDKANAAQTCRDARKGAANAWTAQDYWHAASGGERLHSFVGQVPHVALPQRPNSATWRGLTHEIGLVRAHGHACPCNLSNSDDFYYLNVRAASVEALKRPGLWLCRAAMAEPPRSEVRETRWWLTAQALRAAGRGPEAAALEATHRDYVALRTGLAAGDAATVEPLLERGVLLPPAAPVHPSAIPALARAACRGAESDLQYLEEVFERSDLPAARAILEQPVFATTDLSLRLARCLAYTPPRLREDAALAKMSLLAAACSPAQADALIAWATEVLTRAAPNAWRIERAPLCGLIPLWTTRGMDLQPLADAIATDSWYWSGRNYGASKQLLQALQQHGADLHQLVPKLLRTYAQGSAVEWAQQLPRYNLALFVLGQLGARITQARYDALVVAQPSDDATRRLGHAWCALVTGGALPSPGILGAAARRRARSLYFKSVG